MTFDRAAHQAHLESLAALADSEGAATAAVRVQQLRTDLVSAAARGELSLIERDALLRELDLAVTQLPEVAALRHSPDTAQAARAAREGKEPVADGETDCG